MIGRPVWPCVISALPVVIDHIELVAACVVDIYYVLHTHFYILSSHRIAFEYTHKEHKQNRRRMPGILTQDSDSHVCVCVRKCWHGFPIQIERGAAAAAPLPGRLGVAREMGEAGAAVRAELVRVQRSAGDELLQVERADGAAVDREDWLSAVQGGWFVVVINF